MCADLKRDEAFASATVDDTRSCETFIIRWSLLTTNEQRPWPMANGQWPMTK